MTNNQAIQIAISALEWVIFFIKDTNVVISPEYLEHMQEKEKALETLKQMIKN
jgi:2-polyprenyl-3-methyl-5-hydroxy-6-metoxy-1,4-benzoquinol methylase